MSYGRTISTVGYIAELVSAFLSEAHGENRGTGVKTDNDDQANLRAE
jgi:hypothetical protein